MRSQASHDQSMAAQFYTADVPKTLLNLVDSTQWSSFADLGCGEGVILNALDKMGHFSGKSVYAVDQSVDRLNQVKQINSEFFCLNADASETTIAAGSIDMVISTQVIEHVPDDDAMVKEIQRILTDGGTAFVDTIFKKWYGWYFYRCNGKWTIDPTHVREYTKDSQLLDIFTKNGLEILASTKTLRRVPIMDSVLRRLGAGRDAYRNGLLSLLRGITVPIPGYYIWEVLCKKR